MRIRQKKKLRNSNMFQAEQLSFSKNMLRRILIFYREFQKPISEVKNISRIFFFVSSYL